MEPKRLCRASIDKKICGVCGGIAHYFDVDSNLIRLITAALVLAGGLSVWLYIIAAIILPETNAFYAAEKSGTRGVPDFVVSESISPETRRGRGPHRPKGTNEFAVNFQNNRCILPGRCRHRPLRNIGQSDYSAATSERTVSSVSAMA